MRASGFLIQMTDRPLEMATAACICFNSKKFIFVSFATESDKTTRNLHYSS